MIEAACRIQRAQQLTHELSGCTQRLSVGELCGLRRQGGRADAAEPRRAPMAPVIHVGKFPTPEERLLLLLQAAAGNVVSPALQELSLQVCAPTLLALTSSPPAVSGCSTPETTQSVSTAQAASGWARPLSRHFKIQSCCCLALLSRWRLCLQALQPRFTPRHSGGRDESASHTTVHACARAIGESRGIPRETLNPKTFSDTRGRSRSWRTGCGQWRTG